MSNQKDNRIDTLKDVIEKQSKTLKDRLGDIAMDIDNYPKIYIPDYTSQYEQIGIKLDKLVNRQPDNKLELAIERLEKKLDKVPKSHTEQTQLKILFVYFGLVIATAISFGFALALKIQVNALVELLQKRPDNISKPTFVRYKSINMRRPCTPMGQPKAHRHHSIVNQ